MTVGTQRADGRRGGGFTARLKAGALAAAVTIMASGMVMAADRVQLRFGTGAISGDLPVEMMHVFKEWIDRAAPGEFDVQVHSNGTVVRQGTEVTSLQRGTVESTILSWWDIADRIPDLNILTVGYLFKDWDHVKRVMDGEIGDEYRKRIEDELGIVILDSYYAGPRIVNLREPRPVSVPADLAGVKLRMPGSPSFLLLGEALGASPVAMPLGDVYLGLSTGTVDGQDNPLSTTYRAKFYEVTKQVILTYHSIPANMVGITKSAWDAMSPRHQKIVKGAARAAMSFNDVNKLRDEAEVLDTFQKAGLTITEPDREAFRTHVLEVFKDTEFMTNAPKGWAERIAALADE